jgi:NAD(P)-dependent dehydrogenase (short-subunit alcohol dehydrogenase family)
MGTKVLIIGNGSIGSHLATKFREAGHRVTVAPRNFDARTQEKFHSVVWCQGVNCNDSIGSLNAVDYLHVVDVNLHYTTWTLNDLIKHDRIEDGGRCLIISSLWQDFSRENKFSYTVSKAAIGGLVRSCSIDLGKRGIFINALLPGPIDNEMTRSNLTREQIDTLPGFVNLDDLWYLSEYLCTRNASTNGQSIRVDLGFSVKKM